MNPLHIANAEVQPAQRRVLVDGRPAALGARAFDLLMCLIERRERVVAKSELLAVVWQGTVVEETNLTVHIAALRKLLGAHAISTVPGVGYRFTAPIDAASSAQAVEITRAAGLVAASSPPPPEVPSLAVLPFANLSGDPGQDYFVDGVVDDLTDALSRVRRFIVVARSSSFTYKGRIVDVPTVGRELGVRYVVEGSFRQAGGRLRIGVQLVETGAGLQIWSSRFEGSREDVFALQDEISAQVAAAIEPNLARAEAERVRRKPTESLQAYELCMQALPIAYGAGPTEQFERALALLRRALDADPDYAFAKALYAWTHTAGSANGALRGRRALDGLPYAREAAIDHRDDPTTLAFAGISLAYLGHEHEAARRAIDLALALNPNSVTALRSAGWARTYTCEPDAAIELLQRAMRLNPLDPEIAYVSAGIAWAHLIAGRAEAAVAAARRSLLELPTYRAGQWALLHALCLTGAREEALHLTDKLRADAPGLTQARYRRWLPYTDAAFTARCLADLGRLGVPA
ncbi:winged helix-turn-helix domain-containing protein [Sphaerotilaceae bacterium SBD11-9]